MARGPLRCGTQCSRIGCIGLRPALAIIRYKARIRVFFYDSLLVGRFKQVRIALLTEKSYGGWNYRLSSNMHKCWWRICHLAEAKLSLTWIFSWFGEEKRIWSKPLWSWSGCGIKKKLRSIAGMLQGNQLLPKLLWGIINIGRFVASHSRVKKYNSC